MRRIALARCLTCPFFLVMLLSGCQSLYRYRPVSVLVQDAETKQPIPGATVKLTYPYTLPSRAPCDSSDTTGADGIAHLRAAAYGDVGIMLDGSAPGYQPEELSAPVESVAKIEPVPWFGNDAPRPVTFVLKLYADPKFAAELAVPAGYIGLVKAEVELRDDVPFAAGQRRFCFPVGADGTTHVVGPRVLERASPSDWQGRYPDGTLLSTQAPPDKVGLRPYKRVDDTEYFVVGTQWDYDYIRRSHRADAMAERFERRVRDSGGDRHHRGSQVPAPGTAP